MKAYYILVKKVKQTVIITIIKRRSYLTVSFRSHFANSLRVEKQFTLLVISQPVGH